MRLAVTVPPAPAKWHWKIEFVARQLWDPAKSGRCIEPVTFRNTNDRCGRVKFVEKAAVTKTSSTLLMWATNEYLAKQQLEELVVYLRTMHICTYRHTDNWTNSKRTHACNSRSANRHTVAAPKLDLVQWLIEQCCGRWKSNPTELCVIGSAVLQLITFDIEHLMKLLTTQMSAVMQSTGPANR